MNEQLTLAQMMLWNLVQAIVHLMAYCLASHLVRMMMGTTEDDGTSDDARLSILLYLVHMTNNEGAVDLGADDALELGAGDGTPDGVLLGIASSKDDDGYYRRWYEH